MNTVPFSRQESQRFLRRRISPKKIRVRLLSEVLCKTEAWLLLYNKEIIALKLLFIIAEVSREDSHWKAAR